MARGKWTTFAVVAVGILMATIDSSIVNVSSPTIARHFGVPLGGMVEWIVIAYLVVVAALLLTAGRIADVAGRKATWISGLAVFIAGSALCGAAPSLTSLIAFRGLQGVGGAFLMAISPAMIVSAFPAHERGRALGMNAVVVGIGVSAGPTLGGVITEHLGWRWIFYVNLPLGSIGIAASILFLARDGARTGGRVDWPGALLLAVGLGSFMTAVSFATESETSHAVSLVSALVALVALAGLAMRLARAPEPIIDPVLFKNRVFASASASLLLCFMATFSVAFLLPFYLEQVRGLPSERVGLVLTPMPLTVAAISPWTGALADRVGNRGLATGGIAVAALGLATLAFIDEKTPLSHIVFSLVVVGAGRAIFQPPNNSALMGAAPRARQGSAAGTLATARVIGQATSVAFSGATFAAFGGAEAAGALRHGHVVAASAMTFAFIRGMRAAFGACAIVAGAATLVAAARGDTTAR